MSVSTSSTGRTIMRGFLLLGGVLLFGLGIAQGSSFNIGLGIVAAVLGGFGLWWELNHQPTSDGPDD